MTALPLRLTNLESVVTEEFLHLLSNSNFYKNDLFQHEIKISFYFVGFSLCLTYFLQVYVLYPKQDLHGLGFDPYKHAPEVRGK